MTLRSHYLAAALALLGDQCCHVQFPRPDGKPGDVPTEDPPDPPIMRVSVPNDVVDDLERRRRVVSVHRACSAADEDCSLHGR